MANYTNCLSLEQMEYLDLFDNIPYKVVKKLVKLHDETDFKIEIKDLQHDDYTSVPQVSNSRLRLILVKVLCL